MKYFYQKQQKIEALWERLLQVERLKKLGARFLLIMLPYGWHLVFFLVPFLMVLRISFAESLIGSPPYGEIFSWIDEAFLHIKLNLGNYFFILEDELYLKSYLESLKIAAIATSGCLLLGYPIAYGITRVQGVWRIILLMLVVLPFWTSFLIRIYAWIGLLSTKGLINNALIFMGITSNPLPLMDNNFTVTIGLIYSYLPFMVLPLYASLEKIDLSYVEAAYDLGCKPLKAFFQIIVPLSYRGIIGGVMLVFIPAVGEFIIPALLGGSDSIMIGKILWNEFFFNNDWPLASSLVVMLFIVLFIPILFFQKMLEPPQEQGENP